MPVLCSAANATDVKMALSWPCIFANLPTTSALKTGGFKYAASLSGFAKSAMAWTSSS